MIFYLLSLCVAFETASSHVFTRILSHNTSLFRDSTFLIWSVYLSRSQSHSFSLSVSSNMGVTRLLVQWRREGERERRTGLSLDVENTTTSTHTHTENIIIDKVQKKLFFNRVNEAQDLQQQMNC